MCLGAKTKKVRNVVTDVSSMADPMLDITGKPE